MRNFGLWAAILVVAVLLFALLNPQSKQTPAVAPVDFSKFMNDVRDSNIKSVTVQGEQLTGTYKSGGHFVTNIIPDAGLPQKLSESGIDVKIKPREEGGILSTFLNYWLPMLVILGVWIFLMRQMQGGGGKAMGFGRSKAKLLTEQQGRITFQDVAGIDEAREELNEIVEFLRDPQKFQRLGGRIPKGALLVGPPGTGKTLLARAIAGEAEVPFFTISGSDFVEMFVGVGASRVRDMFEQAKKSAPCIIFIDEIDAVGRHRGAGMGGGNDEREQTLNQLLVEMDGFESNEGIILIAATNRPDVLDPALLRPGRFDRQITVPNPDIKGREAILAVHIKKIAVGPGVDIKVVARGTPGFSGAELANLVNEAALLAARRNKKLVGVAEFEDAKDKVMMGAERRSMAMTDEEKANTAYHEAGHALVGKFVEGNDPLHKVTIIPRGRALGVTMNLPERDRLNMTKREMEARLAMMFGGRVAEEIIFGKENVTTGASNDIMQATNLATSMVTMYGMSQKLGRLRYANRHEGYLGYSDNGSWASSATQKIIDDEIRRLIDEAEQKANDVLEEHLHDLHAVAKALLEYETLSGDEMDAILEGRDIVRKSDDDTPDTPPPTLDKGTIIPLVPRKSNNEPPLEPKPI